MRMAAMTDAFEDLSHALRVLLEADLKANQGLLLYDRAEAVGNIETALAAVLNSFHSLYDATTKMEHGGSLDWYAEPELSTVLVLRNARHHNHAKKIRTLYSYYVQTAKVIGNAEMFTLVDFPSGEEGGDTFDVYLSWDDLKLLFSMPEAATRIRPSVAQSIQKYLGTANFSAFAKNDQLTEDRVFFNVVPLLVNAAAKLTPVIKHLITPRSSEAQFYLSLFKDLIPCDISNPEVISGPIAYVP
jgi:hypothetical protein